VPGFSPESLNRGKILGQTKEVPVKRGLLILAALTLLAAGCSKKTEEPQTTAPVKLSGKVTAHGQKTITGAKPSIDLEVDDDYFEPTFLKVDTGATVSVKLENKGKHSHTFTITALNVDQMLAPGESKTLSFTLPSGPGANFFCKFHGPTGMQGAFYFTEGVTIGSGSTAPTSSTSPTSSAPSDGSGYGY
jgi:plastocyanin